jgi:ribA/ribD-fused uncharacterized protein
MSGIRKYNFSESVVFHKTTAEFGGLSNMCAGYSLNISDIIIPTAEHLYQACRFPNHPEIQFAIVAEASPMNAKWIGRKHIHLTRPDWEMVRFKVMQWVLEVKLSQNWETFGGLLLSTGDKFIVEQAPKDKVWGAVSDGTHLTGVNALGRLLMHVRERFVKTGDYQPCVQPLEIPDFYFMGHSIEMVCNEDYQEDIRWSLSKEYSLA